MKGLPFVSPPSPPVAQSIAGQGTSIPAFVLYAITIASAVGLAALLARAMLANQHREEPSPLTGPGVLLFGLVGVIAVLMQLSIDGTVSIDWEGIRDVGLMLLAVAVKVLAVVVLVLFLLGLYWIQFKWRPRRRKAAAVAKAADLQAARAKVLADLNEARAVLLPELWPWLDGQAAVAGLELTAEGSYAWATEEVSP